MFQKYNRIDVVAYNRKRQTMPSDRRSDKGLPAKSKWVSPGPLSRKPFGFLFSSLGRDGHEASSPEQWQLRHSQGFPKWVARTDFDRTTDFNLHVLFEQHVKSLQLQVTGPPKAVHRPKGAST